METKDCPNCHGTGKRPVYLGFGVDEERAQPDYLKECRSCHGKGQVREEKRKKATQADLWKEIIDPQTGEVFEPYIKRVAKKVG